MDLQIATEKYIANMYANVPEIGALHYRNAALQNKVKKYQVYADFLTIVGEKSLNWKGTHRVVYMHEPSIIL